MKVDRAAYLKKWYEDNKVRVLARHRKMRDDKRALLDKAKDVPCKDCGIRYPPYVMDFDHVRGKKFKTLGHLKGSVAVLLREIAKCEVVCSNCHRIRTWERVWKLQCKL